MACVHGMELTRACRTAPPGLLPGAARPSCCACARSITAFAQLLPNHLEVSYQARAQVSWRCWHSSRSPGASIVLRRQPAAVACAAVLRARLLAVRADARACTFAVLQVFLWPPMEAFFPGFMDVDGLVRHLRPSAKRPRRPTRPRRLKQRRCRLGWARRKPYHAR